MDTNTNDIDNISLPEARVDSDNTGLLSDVIEILELDMFMNQNQSNCDGLVGGIVASATGGAPIGTSIMDTNGQQAQQTILQQHQQQQQQQQQQTQSTLQQQHQQQSSSKSVRKKPYVKIVEQPASKGLRFRYECEGRSAGSIPGVNSTPDNKTFPTIEIVGYKGRAVVVVSCVTKDAPYRPHPHNLVGKEGCKKGVCTIEINSETMRAVFSNLGIQCVKKKDIAAALKAREEIRVDPFKTGSTYKNQTSNIDLNSVRLCFQVFLEGEQKGRFTQPIAPVVSDPIYDKKAMSDLVICRLCSCSSTVAGGATIILLCEKVSKDDISVRFYQEKNGKETWVAFGEFQQTDVHKQTAITFKTPRFHTMEIDKPETVFIQLYRPSDGITSESLPFDYVPLESGMRTFWAMRRNLKRKPDIDIFQQIRSIDDIESIATTNITSPLLEEVITMSDSVMEERENAQTSSSSTPATESEDVNDADTIKRQNEYEIDHIVNEKVREMQIDLTPPQHCEQENEKYQFVAQTTVAIVEETTPPPPMIVENNENSLQEQFSIESEPHQLNPNDKITEWMKSSEFERTDSLLTDPGDPGENVSSPTTCITDASETALPMTNSSDEDKALNDLLDQVAELDEIYTDHQLRRDTFRNTIVNELNCIPDPVAMETSMDIDESFDDAATYTSLQIAFKNPITIPMTDIMPPTPPASQLAPEDAHYDAVEVQSNPPSSTKIETNHLVMQSNFQSPPPTTQPKPIANDKQNIIFTEEEEKLPPLPPKRVRKQENNSEEYSIEANKSNSQLNVFNSMEPSSRSQSQIIIMKTPDQSPTTKRLPATPNTSNCANGNSSTLPRQKKPGFFSKLFSRRKSKPDINQPETNAKSTGSLSSRGTSFKSTLPPGFRPPIVKPFPLKDADAAVLRPAKSMQPLTTPTSILSPSSSSIKKSGSAKGKLSKNRNNKPVGRSVSSVSGKRPQLTADVIHIPLKGGESLNNLQQPHAEAYSNASTVTLSNNLDRRTVSALQLADIPIQDGNMELVAIADRQSLKNLCEGEFGVKLDDDVDLTEAEHFALYTSIPPQATASEFDETSCYYAPVDAGEILTPDEVAKRLAEANRINVIK